MTAADMDTLMDLASLDFLRGHCVVGIFIDVVMGSQMILIQSERSLSSSTGRDVQGTSLLMVGPGTAFVLFLGDACIFTSCTSLSKVRAVSAFEPILTSLT